MPKKFCDNVFLDKEVKYNNKTKNSNIKTLAGAWN